MGWYGDSRRSTPGLWLGCALATDLATYAVVRHGTTGVFWWVLLDLWLTYRIWRGGSVALTIFRFLQVLGAGLFGVAITFGGPLNLETPVTPPVVVLYVVSAWCLFAPALDTHIARRRRRLPRSVGEAQRQAR